MSTRIWGVFAMAGLAACGSGGGSGGESAGPEERTSFTGAPGEVKLVTLDPGHFHAALVQMSSFALVAARVHVFAPEGPEVEGLLGRIEG